MPETPTCSLPGCGRATANSLEKLPYCREHFLVACYTRLEEFAGRLQDRPFNEDGSRVLREFLQECATQATEMARTAGDLDNLSRARLIDILMWTGELGRRLRRSLRKAVAIPVRLLSEKPGRLWEEETRTQILSRHGAMLECHHAVRTGDTLGIRRLDTGQQAIARVAWQRLKAENQVEMGLEFLSPETLWNHEFSPEEMR